MALTLAAFRARWTAFADVVTYPDTLVDLVLQEASRRVSPVYFRNRENDAHGHLTAHLLTLTTPGGGGAQAASGIASVSAGSVSVSFVQPNGATDPAGLATTSYGREFIAIRRSVGPASQVL